MKLPFFMLNIPNMGILGQKMADSRNFRFFEALAHVLVDGIAIYLIVIAKIICFKVQTKNPAATVRLGREVGADQSDRPARAINRHLLTIGP